MDPSVIAAETGISLEEAQKLVEWSVGPGPAPESVDARGEARSDAVQDPEIDFLEKCFPDIPPAIVRIKYGECRNVEQASDLLLNWSLTRNEGHQYIDKRLQREAKERHKRDKRKGKLESKRSEEVERLTQVIDDLSYEQALDLYNQNDCRFDNAVSAHFKLAAPHVHQMIAGMEKLHVGGGTAKQGGAPSEQSVLNFEAAQLKLQAELERLESYRRTKGVPRELISEIHGRIANLRSITAEAHIVEAVNSFADAANTIDFHNMTVKAAVAVCEYKVKEWKNQTSPHLYLITGAGRHSHKGVPVIKNAVRDVVKKLNDRRYFVKEEEGAFLLTRTMR